MNIKPINALLLSRKKNLMHCVVMVLLVMISHVKFVLANELAIQSLDFTVVSGNKIQVQMEMNGMAVNPKVFQTDNPSRIALDFYGVKNNLGKKSFTVNKGAIGKIYVAEAVGRTRIIVNLVEHVPYETKISGNKVLLTLKNSNISLQTQSQPQSQTIKVESIPKTTIRTENSVAEDRNVSVVSRLIPKQIIKDIDFRRGSNGEGLLIVALTNPNTVVDVKEQAGKVVLKFLNTKLPEVFRKRFDVSDFATPVQKIDALKKFADTEITITTANANYDYSSYQEDGLLTVSFRPMSASEKEAKVKEKFPFSGDRLSLNFESIRITSVLQILADFTELNIIAADDVDGEVTLRLDDVPWDQALDMILKSKGLSQRKTGNVVLVAPTEKIILLEEKELEAKKVVEQLEPLITEYIQINYARAEDIRGMLLGSKKASTSTTKTTFSVGRLLSKRGVATVDVRTNMLIVKDTADKMEEMRHLINLLDIPIRQVMIEARIVNADKNFAKDIGFRFGIGGSARTGSRGRFAIGPRPTIGGLESGDFDAENGTFESGGVFVPSITGEDGESNYLFDLASQGANAFPPAALGMTLARAADYVLNLEISALEGENRGELISNPRVLTSDRIEAIIRQGVQIPFSTVSADGTETEFIDAVLELKVTPQITPNGSIIMELAIKNDAANDSGGINKEEVITTVQVNDGETIVLGGIYANDRDKNVTKVPVLGDIPILGALFRNKQETERKKELLVFVTPKIVKNSLSLR